ncbi:MAG: DUF6470 family protein [Alicyclobacillus sp.]|nr:DUF6470 family protein [Alicyclobacillus sp.]
MVPQIDIHQVLGQIGLRYTPQQWQVDAPAGRLEIQNATDTLDIQYTPGQLTIDQTQAFADEGLRAPIEFMRHQAALAAEAAANGTASTAAWGQRFLHIEKGDPTKQYVSRYAAEQRQFRPTLVPGPFSVHIHYQPGSVQIYVDVQPPRVEEQVQPVRVALTPERVHAYAAQPPELQISSPPVGALIDMRK